MKIIAALMLAFALCICAAQRTTAKEHYHENTIKAETKEAFEELATSVHKEMEPNGKYEYVKPDEKKKIEAALDKMDKLFQQKDTIATMTQDEKITLFNAQEIVNSILTLRDRDRVICKNEAPLGSHIPVTTCHTYGQEVEAREGTKKIMADWGRPQCVGASPACAGH